jgi:hypothetical protein
VHLDLARESSTGHGLGDKEKETYLYLTKYISFLNDMKQAYEILEKISMSTEMNQGPRRACEHQYHMDREYLPHWTGHMPRHEQTRDTSSRPRVQEGRRGQKNEDIHRGCGRFLGIPEQSIRQLVLSNKIPVRAFPTTRNDTDETSSRPGLMYTGIQAAADEIERVNIAGRGKNQGMAYFPEPAPTRPYPPSSLPRYSGSNQPSRMG